MAAPIPGNTLFLGDSITVNLAPFVQVAGEKQSLAEGGKTADWLLSKLRGLESAGGLDGSDRPVNVVVLIGTNDVGGGRTPSKIFADVSAIWSIARDHGARVIAMTVPPFKGYPGYAARYDEHEGKRRALNALIAASKIPHLLIRLDEGPVVQADDPERLTPEFDAGDHIHLKKNALASLIQARVTGAKLPEPLPSRPGLPKPIPPTTQTVSLLPYFMLGFVALAPFGAVILTRKTRY
jgi:lysophospholipase L1-like esterase